MLISSLNFVLLFLGLGGSELLVIMLVVLLLFGGKKIPELMRGLGKGVRSFKDGMKDVTTDDEKEKEEKCRQDPRRGGHGGSEPVLPGEH